MTGDQAIKIHLVALAEYLQCTLSDAQVLMYARELDIDPDQLALAIALLKQDADVWPGRFPLPGKIKSYLRTDAEDQANTMVINILKAADDGSHDAYTRLSPQEKEVIKVYGWVNLANMMIGQRPNYITNMRSIAKTIITNNEAPERIALVQQQEQSIADQRGPDVWEHP
jgi:hypothetical protein